MTIAMPSESFYFGLQADCSSVIWIGHEQCAFILLLIILVLHHFSCISMFCQSQVPEKIVGTNHKA